MKQLLIKLSMLVAIPAIAIGYTNCSKVAFDSMELSSEGKKLAINQGGIVINDDAPFTNNADVNLRLIHNSAEEMYVTSDSTCEAGGSWEVYAQNKEWKLSANNAEGKVFVRYREMGSTEIVSDCYADAIVHDDVAPVIDFKRATGTYFNTANFAFEHSITDNLSGVGVLGCNANSAWSSACNSTTKIHTLPEGLHQIKIVATDRAGNKSLSKEDAFTIDLTAPTIAFLQTPPAITADLGSRFAFVGSDALSGVDKYECSSNGAAFTACSSPLTQSFPEGNNQFAVLVYDRAGNKSAPINHSWTIDKTAPSVRITSGPEGFTNNPVAVFTFDGTDGSVAITKFECRIGAAAFAGCSSPYTSASVVDGSYKFEVRGIDAAGNASSPANRSWTIDTVKPVVALNSYPPAKTKDRNGTIVWTATDNSSGIQEVKCRINGAAYANCAAPSIFTNLIDGTYRFEIYAKDKAGNQSPTVAYTWKIDGTKPVVEITSGPDAQSRSKSGALTFIANDPNGGIIARIECRLDGAAFATCLSPESYANLPEGSRLFQVRAFDDFGNESDTKSYAWFVDSMGPDINFLKQPASVIQRGESSNVKFLVTDAGTGVKNVSCGLNGDMDVCPASFEVNLANLPVGDYVVRVEAEDNLGNRTIGEVKWTVEIKTVPVSQNVAVNVNNKVDVLIVIDNSGSMDYEQTSMASRFGSFLDRLQGLDWRVGIISTDIDSDTDLRQGRLIKYTGLTNNYYIDSSMNYATAKSAFSQTIQRPGWEGSAWEQGIGATYLSIDRALNYNQALPENKRNRDFYRDDAMLSVVVVTDAYETMWGSGNYYNSPTNLVKLVKGKWPDKPFVFHSIIVKTGDLTCLRSKPAGFQGNEQEGYHYEQMSAMTGGLVGSVCATDYAAQLGSIGQATVDQVRSSNLDCAPLDTNADGKADVQIITSNGSAAPSYTVSGLKITFSTTLPAGTNQLKYTCIAP